MALSRQLLGLRSVDREVLSLVEHDGSLFDIDKALQNGANSNVRDYRREASAGFEGYTPLHYAFSWFGAGGTRRNLVALLLRNGANPNIRSKYGHTPLHNFAIRSDLDCLEMLLSAGAVPDIFNSSGHTALHNAALFGHAEIVQRLLAHGFNVNAQKRKKNPLINGYTPLHSAIFTGGDEDEESRLKTIVTLISAGADLTRGTGAGADSQTPLQRAEDHMLLVKHGFNSSEDNRKRSIALMEKIIDVISKAAEKRP